MSTPPASAVPGEDGTPPVPVDDTEAPEFTEASSVQPSYAELDFQLPGIDDRERALPIRQQDLTRLLLAEPGLEPSDRERLAQVGNLIGATFHHQFYGRLRELKELYAPLDPDSDYACLKDHSRRLEESSDEAFLVPFEETLIQANYSRLDLDHIKEAVSAPNEMGLTYIPDFELFEHLEVWVRGYTRVTRDCRNLRTRFRKRTASLAAYQRLVVAIKFKPGCMLGPYIRDDVLYLRMFKDVPHVDMEMHLPEQGTKVRMRLIDKAQIASPLVMGIPTLILKVLSIVTFSPLIIGGMLIGPISAGVNSFFGYHRSRQRHLNAMIHRLYYLTLANNASVLTRLIDSAEDEEYKETMLAYFFLLRARTQSPPPTIAQLDEQIEKFLKEKTGIEINFEVADALGKLFRHGLASRDPRGALRAVSLEHALANLNRQWDDLFPNG